MRKKNEIKELGVSKERLTKWINDAIIIDRAGGIEPNAMRVADHVKRILAQRCGLDQTDIDVDVDPDTGAVNVTATTPSGPLAICLQ